MILLLLAFLLLVTGSVIATFVGLQTTAKDALVINLAGRQRMLIQQMTKDAVAIGMGGEVSRIPALQETSFTFEHTLQALISGGQASHPQDGMVNVPAPQNPDTLTRLQQVRSTWNIFFRGHLNVIATAEPGSADFKEALQAVRRLSPRLLQQADDVVRAYEATSEVKVARLRWVQIAFFVSALALLALGSWVTQKSVIDPLRVLEAIAERIGRGDLDTPVEMRGPSEIERLAHRFDTMQKQLQASQAELTAWTQELEARVDQRTRQLAALYEQAERVAVLEERQRIAAEMHDGLTQTLSYLHLQVDQVSELVAVGQKEDALSALGRIREALVGAVDEVRANIADLSASPAPPQSLPELLAETVQETGGDQAIELVVGDPKLEDLRVMPDVAEQVRRIVQEAVTNACRHTGASRIQMRLQQVEDEAVIVVEDDGRGFDPDQTPADGRHHFGLSTMQARAARVGGRLDVESAPGRGTRVTLRWPLDDKRNREDGNREAD